MILYGIKIDSDIEFSYDFSQTTQHRYTKKLRTNPPANLKDSINLGWRLYQAHGRKVYLYSNQEFNSYEAKQPFCYQVEDILKFYWIAHEDTIYYEFTQEADTHLLSFWFTHLMLPFYIALEQMYDIFHGGAVEVDGKPILFLAPSTGGKSTMTDFFIKQKHTLISDDKVPTFIQNDQFYIVGSHPYHRPYRKFEDLGYRVDNFISAFKPIHAFYLLDRAKATDEISIQEIRGFEKFNSLLPHYLFSFKWHKVKRLKYLSYINNSIKIFRIKVPWDLNRLPEVHKIIVSHSNSLQGDRL